MRARWRLEGRAGRAAPGLWNRVVVRVVVRDFKERKSVYPFKSPTTTRTTTRFETFGRPQAPGLTCDLHRPTPVRTN